MRCTLIVGLTMTLGLGLGAPLAHADVFAGRELYQTHCTVCHGPEGVPLVPGSPDFSRGDGLFNPDSFIFQVIKQGTSQMPRYEGILRDREILDIVDFLRTLPR